MSEARLLKIVEDLYQGATTGGGWERSLNQMADLAGAELASLAIASRQEGLFSILSPRTDTAITQEFGAQWVDKDITMAATARSGVGQIVTLQDSDRDAFLSSEFYNDFWKRTGYGAERIRTNLIKDQKAQVIFCLGPYRHRDEISMEMYAVATAIIPHLVQAMGIQFRMRSLQLERTLSNALIRSAAGVVVVNNDGRVLTADPKAEEMLSGDGPLYTCKGQLTARAAADTVAIRRMIVSCAPKARGFQLRGGVLSIRYAGYPQINASILPVTETISDFALDVGANLDPVAMIALEEPGKERLRFVDQLTSRFGLTPAEASVALELMDGDGRQAVAARLGVSESTVRTHMSRIFEKTQVQRQAQLVRLLMELASGPRI